MNCIIDYETRSKVDLKKTGAIVYAQHESTSILCLGYRIDVQPAKLWIPERGPMPGDLRQAFEKGILVAHNAGFERAITRYTLTRYLSDELHQRVIHKTAPHFWICTAAKAAASSLPRSLEDACNALSLPIKKDMEGSRLMKKYRKPRKPSMHNPKEWWDDKDELRRIYKYCLIDVNAEYELHHAIPNLSDDEQSVWELDQKINDRGILIDVETCKLILKMITEERIHIDKKVQELTDGEIKSASQTAKVLEWLNARGAEMKNLQAPIIKDVLKDKNLLKDVREMLKLRQASSKSSTSKYKAMLAAIGEDHRAKELLLYCGADRTGRWSGKRIQPQNFPRPTPELQKRGFNSDLAIELIKKGNINLVRTAYGPSKVMDVFASCVRGMIIPSPGKEFFCADFAAVEARVAFWIAKCAAGLKAFSEDQKIYEEMAAYAFDIDLNWLLTKEGKESLERFVGKESILGCQYGMAWLKFLNQCHKKGMKSVTPKIAKKAVRAYRDRYPEICYAWANLEWAAIEAIKNPGEVYKTNRVSIYVKGEFLIIKLPSGRKVKCFKPHLVNVERFGKLKPEIRYWSKGWAVNPKTGKPHKTWCVVKTWGGTIFNWVVQGTARDLMVHGIKRIEKAEYEFVLSVHDEGLSEREKGKGSLDEYLHLMAGELPTWGKGIPLKAEGWVGQRYKK